MTTPATRPAAPAGPDGTGPGTDPTGETRRGRAIPAPRGEAGARGPRELSDRTLVAIAAAVTLPLVWMGYGTDIDIADVRSSAATIRHGDYVPSRPPGVPVFEAVTAVLDPIGGHLLLNLATAAAGAATVVGIARLVRHWGRPNGDLVALAFLASPATVIAATSAGDFIWAVAFTVWGTLHHLRNRPVVAGVLFALAIGSRLSSVFLVAALLAADGWARDRRRACLRTLAVALPLGALLYLPSWAFYDWSADILRTAEGWRSFANNLGRFAYKNYATGGVLLVVVAAVATPALARALRRFGHDPLVRLGAGAFVVTEALYLVLPWKLLHLLPALMGLLLWLAASDRNRRPFLWLTIAAVALNGFVTFRPLIPDAPTEARSGRWDPAVTVGLLLNDIDCRLEAMHDDPPPLNREAWACTLEPVRGPAEDPVPTGDDPLSPWR